MWENRYKLDKGNDCLISVDGTDFRVAENGRKFYSHKFKKSALRYEIGLCILTGDVVWLNGPYVAGSHNDITIFRDCLLSHLDHNERVEADDGYRGEHPEFVKCPAGFSNPADNLKMQQRVRSRQETINKRFKDWGCLRQTWRHDIASHGRAFRVILIVSQLAINNGEKLFFVDCTDPS